MRQVTVATASVSRQAGFSLVELSLVMIIIGLVTAASLSVYTPTAKMSSKAKNEVAVQKIAETVKGYSGSNRQIPNLDSFKSAVPNITDELSNRVFYLYSGTLYNENPDPDEVADICNVNETNLSVQYPLKNETATVNNVAFVIWSTGFDAKGNHSNTTLYNGGVSTASYSPLPDTPYTFTVPKYDDQTSGSYMDDLFSWVTLAELKEKADCGPGIRFLTDRVQDAKEGKIYLETSSSSESRIYIEGGVAPYQWCIETEGAAVANTIAGFFLDYYDGTGFQDDVGASYLDSNVNSNPVPIVYNDGLGNDGSGGTTATCANNAQGSATWATGVSDDQTPYVPIAKHSSDTTFGSSTANTYSFTVHVKDAAGNEASKDFDLFVSSSGSGSDFCSGTTTPGSTWTDSGNEVGTVIDISTCNLSSSPSQVFLTPVSSSGFTEMRLAPYVYSTNSTQVYVGMMVEDDVPPAPDTWHSAVDLNGGIDTIYLNWMVVP
ncbi:MAG: type II secretion system protein [Magnetococcales bacterium]|nr:type II secretion system protein [Magnetococcales bacterium]